MLWQGAKKLLSVLAISIPEIIFNMEIIEPKL